MRLALRPILGISAAAMAVGFVILAGLTAPAEESTLHVSAKCPAGADKSPLQTVTSGAESPA
ncbi:MAG: hypothetical protein ABMA14_11810 [Hyphomonadaceae bacterium]